MKVISSFADRRCGGPGRKRARRLTSAAQTLTVACRDLADATLPMAAQYSKGGEIA